ACLLHHRNCGPGSQCSRHKPAAISGGTRPGDEAVTCSQLAAVAQQITSHTFVQPLGDLNGLLQALHQNDSSTASVTICGLTLISGCTPKTRRVCCTVSLNKGAATS